MTGDKQKLQIGVQVSIWLLFGLSYTLIFARFIPALHSFVRALGNMLPMIVLFYGNMRLVERFFIPKLYVRYAVWCLLLTTLVTAVRTQINLLFTGYDIDFLPEHNQKFLRLASIISNTGVILISTIYQLLIHRGNQEKKALLAANEHQEAQLQFLRSQINPHFLFNTLNNIYSLAVTHSQKTAPMVLQLSELLRYVVYEGQAEKVELEREVQQINRFISLFQMRQEEPVDIQFKTTTIPEDLKIEPMILIPLVENCFKHCDFDTDPQASTRIALKVENNELYFHTYNTRDDLDLQKDATGGVGLKNIRKRLGLKYPDGHRLEIDKQPKSFQVDLYIKL
ncbi:MAG: sensor histidine kinase [Saprospiraceae bacterium]|nr:sensor histidine kinase [Saprospiraceae bacterium]